MKDGVIADFELTEIMLNAFIKKMKARNLFTKPIILICCPTNITPVERNGKQVYIYKTKYGNKEIIANDEIELIEKIKKQ
jgi:rod shape-determining protein MreB